MSPATIDRYLRPARERDPLRGLSSTKPSPLLRSSITIRRAGDEVEDEPGFFEVDTVAHCGPTLKGEFCRTVNLTDMRLGWVHTRSMRNNAAVHVLAVMNSAIEAIPFAVTGLDFDNGGEFINHDLVNWAADRHIFFTRGRPYRKNDQATIESKNGHLVRAYAFHWRYDTPEALRLLNQLWPLVNDRFNYFARSRTARLPRQPQPGRARSPHPNHPGPARSDRPRTHAQARRQPPTATARHRSRREAAPSQLTTHAGIPT